MRIRLLLFTLIILALYTTAYCCSGVVICTDSLKVYANNEDFYESTDFFFFREGGENSYAYMKIEKEYQAVQAGWNEAGLCMDGFSVPYLNPTQNIGKPALPFTFGDSVLAYCATVADVVDYLNNYYLDGMFAYNQFIFIDASGASLLLEGDEGYYRTGETQIAMNFRYSDKSLGNWPDTRYLAMTRVLTAADSLTWDVALDAIQASSVNTPQVKTRYTYLYDIQRQEMTFYLLRRFDDPRVFTFDDFRALGDEVKVMSDFWEPDLDFVAEALPSRTLLPVAWPNPFNASTSLRYELRQPTHVSVNVFDVQGRLVETLSEGQQMAGRHQTVWDAKHHASGTYFIRIKADESSEILRVQLIR